MVELTGCRLAEMPAEGEDVRSQLTLVVISELADFFQAEMNAARIAPVGLHGHR